MVHEDIIRDMNIARDFLSKTNTSIVVVKDGSVLSEKRGDGIRPILQTIDELKDKIYGSVVGDRILGKASALLCVYSKVKGVYSLQGTKTAIAVMILAGIPVQVDKLVPYIKNKTGDGLCPFEQILKDVDKPVDAYNILKNKIQG